jgi:hypothetical protein
MTPEAAAKAGEILRDMGVLQGNIASIDAALENSTFLAGGPLPTDNPDDPINLPPLTAEESKAVFGAVHDVLSARLKLLTDALSEM